MVLTIISYIAETVMEERCYIVCNALYQVSCHYELFHVFIVIYIMHI